MAKLLLENMAEVNIPAGSESNIPLTLACWKGTVVCTYVSELNIMVPHWLLPTSAHDRANSNLLVTVHFQWGSQ